MRRIGIGVVLLIFSFAVHAQTITTVAGNGSYIRSGDGGSAIMAGIGEPTDCSFDSFGNLYINDVLGNVIRKVTPCGIISTVAGTGHAGYNGDGIPATSAELNGPTSPVFDSLNNMYISEGLNNRIRKIDAITGIISTIAGNGVAGFGGDGGSSTYSILNNPGFICFDKHWNLYITDCGNARIRKINTSGIINTVTGTGTEGYTGDGGLATSAEIENLFGICADTIGNIFFTQQVTNRVREIDTAGIITTVAGDGYYIDTGDGGLAIDAGLDAAGIIHDKFNNFYVGGWIGYNVRKIDNSGIIYTVAGNGIYGYSGDGGLADSAELGTVEGVAVDSYGNLYITDIDHYYVRKVTFFPIVVPNVHITASSADTICSGSPITFTAVVTADSIPAYQWLVNGNPVTDTSNTYTYTPANGDSIRCVLSGPNICNSISSNTIIITDTGAMPGVYITTGSSYTVCAGTAVTYTAVASGSSTANYIWYVNGAAASVAGNMYTYTPSAGDSVYCLLAGSYVCSGTYDTVMSNSISMTVNPLAAPSVHITASTSDTICAGVAVTYTATVTNGGISPGYQWAVNSVLAGISATYAYTPANGDTVSCIITSDAACATPAIASSNYLIMTVTPVVIPAVTITATTSDTICAGVAVTYTAAVANGGLSPAYQWLVNGRPVSATEAFTYTPANGDTVSCLLTSDEACAIPLTAVSNSVIMAVNPSLIPSITITAIPGDTICGKQPVTFTAVTTDGGLLPAYQWVVDGSITGAADTSYTYIPNNGDSVRCVLTSSGGECIAAGMYSSNTIDMVVESFTTPAITIAGPAGDTIGSLVTFTATVTDTGGSYSIEWFNDGVLFATTTAPFVTYTKVHVTDSITAEIIPAAFCYDSAFAALQVVDDPGLGVVNYSTQGIAVYPNPAHDMLTITGNGINYVTISNLLGQVLYSEPYNCQSVTVDVSRLADGVYIVKVNGLVRRFVKE